MPLIDSADEEEDPVLNDAFGKIGFNNEALSGGGLS